MSDLHNLRIQVSVDPKPGDQRHRCVNPRCRDVSKHRLCLSCRYALKWGLFIGGVIGGIVAALLK